jgi:hypothetical protein
MNDADIKEIKVACRAGIIIPANLFILSFLIASALFIDNGFTLSFSLMFSFFATLIFAGLISFLINRNYYQDLRDQEKDESYSIVQKKQHRKDFEAGSGVITKFLAKPMREFIRYDIIVDNTIYRVDEKLYNECAEGDRIILYFARHSRYHLGFELKK